MGQRDSPFIPKSGYADAGASRSKRALKGFIVKSLDALSDIDANNQTLRQRARMLYMSTPLATSAVKTNRTNVIGVGLKLRSRVNRELLGMSQAEAEDWQTKTESEFALWAENKRACDATGVNDFYAMQQLAFMSWLLSGDVFGLVKRYEPTTLFPYSMRVHLIEADRVSTPPDCATGILRTTVYKPLNNGNKIYDGVEVDRNGLVQAYHVRSQYSDDAEWVRVTAFGEQTGLPNIIQLMDSERPDQYRGVSYLAHVIEPLLQLRRYTESELMAALIESFFTAFITSHEDPTEPLYNETGAGLDVGEMEASDNIPSSGGDAEYEMGPGQIHHLRPGESVVSLDPKRPTSGFDAFFQSISRQLGAALEIPADLLVKSFNASYSASRAALLEAWKSFRMRREWFVNDFCNPIYEVWMAEAVSLGRIKAPGFFTNPSMRSAYLNAEWIGPPQGQLDPVKEVNAEILACAHGFSTREQSTVKLGGGSWDANVERMAWENQKMADAHLEQPPQAQERNDANGTADE